LVIDPDMKKIRLRLLLVVLSVLSVSLVPCQAADNKPVNIVTTIKPVQALVQAIAGDQLTSVQLIPNGASPHFYALKPSDRKLLARADVLFRIDETLESFLNAALEGQSTLQVINLTGVEGVQLHAFEKHEDEKDGHHDDHQHHHHGNEYDVHIWLDADNGIAMVQKIVAVLQSLDQANADVYAENANALIAAIQEADQAIKQKLEVIKQVPYLVHHDAWGYFEKRYQLNRVDAVNNISGQQPGAASVQRLLALIKEKNIKCLFIEPSFEASMVKLLKEETGIKTGMLDPLGVDIPMNGQTYPALLQAASDDLFACLKNAH
jgi:zinc transport system substrate-binding protein